MTQGIYRRLFVLSHAFVQGMMTACFSSVNWSMTCQSTEAEGVLGLVTEGCNVMSDRMLISKLSVSLEALETLYAEAVDAMAPPDCELKLTISESLASDV